MSDEALAPSNGATNDVAQVSDAGQAAPVEAVVSQASAETSKPSATTREALDRAFDAVDGGQQQGRERAPDGKFVAKAAVAPQVTTQQSTAEALAAQEAAKAAAPPVDAPAIAPPPGLTKEAQAVWAQTPEPVRKDFERRVTELTQGLEKYKGEVAAFEPIRKYADMAKQHGTTLDQALANYTGIETAILSNPVQGFLQICQNMNLNPQAVGQALAGMSPQQAAQLMQPQQQAPQTPAEVKELKERLEKIENQTKAQQVEQVVQTFAAEKDADGALKHPYFDELASDISQMLETGFAKDLPDAYQKAARLNPEIADRIAKDKASKEAAKTPQHDPAQTREKAAKSITGSPSVASNASTKKPAGSTREALDNAFAAVGL